MDQADGNHIAHLREALSIRGIPIKTLSERINIPYRTLYNYFNGTSDMPLRTFVAICNSASIPVEWPLHGNRAKLDHACLVKALVELFDVHMPSVDSANGMKIIQRPQNRTAVRDIYRDATFIAALLESGYDRAMAGEIEGEAT